MCVKLFIENEPSKICHIVVAIMPTDGIEL